MQIENTPNAEATVIWNQSMGPNISQYVPKTKDGANDSMAFKDSLLLSSFYLL